jgi:hypothetical protein
MMHRAQSLQADIMWKALWKKWTIDKPAAFGDLLWEVFVVQFAAYLDRLTLRRIIALIPIVILVLAYEHKIPIPPTIMLLGDFLAYMDLFSVLFLLGVLSRVSTILFIVKQVTARIGRLASRIITEVRRQGFGQPRESGSSGRKRLMGRSKDDDDEPAIAGGLAWA